MIFIDNIVLFNETKLSSVIYLTRLGNLSNLRAKLSVTVLMLLTRA